MWKKIIKISVSVKRFFRCRYVTMSYTIIISETFSLQYLKCRCGLYDNSYVGKNNETIRTLQPPRKKCRSHATSEHRSRELGKVPTRNSARAHESHDLMSTNTARTTGTRPLGRLDSGGRLRPPAAQRIRPPA